MNRNQKFGPVAVAIPARNEAAHIGACLAALTQQMNAQIDHIVLCVNNTTDATIRIARATHLPPPTTLHVIECDLPRRYAHAGQARRLAMEKAYRLVGESGVLLTTDADGIVDANWTHANLAALRAGADAVAGWVDLDPESWHQIPMKLHEDDARECAYDALCDEIHARLDPDPADPMPRHTQHSGASIAVTGRMYRRCGGLPAINHGEDRAFIAALRLADARIRHAPECHVTVSGRIEGRAPGGMADTIRRRLAAPDPYLDDRLEPADLCAKRARLRRTLRRCRANMEGLQDFAGETGLSQLVLGQLLHINSFGHAWAFVERESPALRRQRVAVADLPGQMRRAQEICDALRLRDDRRTAKPPASLAEAAD
jgi:glycosyltransferase involved in cell wall biosynthesis